MITSFLHDIYKSRNLIWELSKRDYKQQNQGSYLGVFWNYLQPILFVTVLYAVFTLGFKTGNDTNIPFSLYLISGMVCWLYFVENLNAMTNVIRNYSFLVKKVDFRLSILPVVKLTSTFLPHLILTTLAIGFSASQGWTPSWHLLQLIYYYICMALLLLGVGWLTSSTNIFIKDIGNIVSVISQFGFWVTPILWQVETIPQKFQWILNLNPAYYLVTGYRDAILSQQWFWHKIEESLIFWGITLTLVVLGVYVFKSLKPHFAEVI